MSLNWSKEMWLLQWVIAIQFRKLRLHFCVALRQVLSPQATCALHTFLVTFGDSVWWKMVTLISENKLFYCYEYLAVSIAVSNCTAYWRMSDKELGHVLLMNTWRDTGFHKNIDLLDHLNDCQHTKYSCTIEFIIYLINCSPHQLLITLWKVWGFDETLLIMLSLSQYS
jgi:hypothetical protein